METREERLKRLVDKAELMLTMDDDAFTKFLKELDASIGLEERDYKREDLPYARIGAALSCVEAIKNIVRLM